jgi:hypothetical protein
MGENLVSSLTTVALAIVSLGILATLVSKNANTTGVINSGARGFTSALSAAEGPVIGSSGMNNLNYQSAGYVDD